MVLRMSRHAQTPGMREQVIETCTELKLRPPFEAIDLLLRMSKARNYVIEVAPHPMIGHTVSGFVHPFRDGVFIIYYQHDAPKVLLEYIIYHELAHIWLKHITPESVKVLRDGTFVTLTSPQQERDADEWARYMTAHAQIMTGRELAERLHATGVQRFSRYGKMLRHFEV